MVTTGDPHDFRTSFRIQSQYSNQWFTNGAATLHHLSKLPSGYLTYCGCHLGWLKHEPLLKKVMGWINHIPQPVDFATIRMENDP